MLKTILAISGKPGLFKLISQGKNMLVVESLLTSKRIPAYTHEKMVSLGDIAMFTHEGETPLSEVLTTIFEKEKGAAASISPKAKPEELMSYFGEILPSFDKERVYPTDIKKVITWYNMLVDKGYTDFTSPTTESSEPVTEK